MEHWHRSGTALLDEIAATHLPASQLAVWYIGQCGFLFKCGETTFCIDPVLSDLTGPNGSRRCYPAPFAPGQGKDGYGVLRWPTHRVKFREAILHTRNRRRQG